MVMGIEKEVRSCLKEKALVARESTRARQDIDGYDIYIHKQYTTKVKSS